MLLTILLQLLTVHSHTMLTGHHTFKDVRVAHAPSKKTPIPSYAQVSARWLLCWWCRWYRVPYLS
jgi:hypothetical protein